MKDAPVMADQLLEDLNSKLSEFVDKALGFGFLEEQVKGQLVKLRKPVLFRSDFSTDSIFYSIDSTSSAKDIARLNNIFQLTTPETDCRAEGKISVGSQTSQDQRELCFFFKRVIAKRCIPVPKFRELIPVRKSAHAEDGRWIVERFGNQLCTDEFYGGVAKISFTWSHSARMNASELISSVQAAMASGDLKKELIRTCESNQINCEAKVKGFALSDSTKGTLTSTVDVMNLIESLNHLPIDCAVPVGTSTVPIQNTRGFPHTVNVETKIRDLEMQEKLMGLLQRIQDNGGEDSALYELVGRLGEMIEDAAINDRTLLPHLKELANSVVQTLVHHGKCVHLYERYGEYRLHTENCSTEVVTASATETLAGVTFGISVPFVRHYQKGLFKNSKKWMTPEHYTTTEIRRTLAISGYYNRVKLRLLFDDEELVRSWRGQMKNLFTKRTNPGFWKSLFHVLSA